MHIYNFEVKNKKRRDYMYDIIIVGAGPTGLTAALYALRANKKVLLLEAKAYGGQIVKASVVKNYPAIKEISGFDFAQTLYEQVMDLGGELKYETVLKVNEDKSVVTNEDTYQAKAVIIATGVENRKLNLEGESEYIGKGVSYCASCDGALYKDQVVAVVGGGNTALEDALYLSNIAQKVYLIHRREDFRGEAKILDELRDKNNIEFILNANVVKLKGEEKLESIDVKIGEEIKNLPVAGLFIAVGQEPKNEIFANIVDLNEYGYIETVDEVFTKIPGIYVAGDARIKALRQLTTAVSDGSIAATAAIKEINSNKKQIL